MKPRLKAASLTLQDSIIWHRVSSRQVGAGRRRFDGARLIEASAKCDRRDADLMLHFKRAYGDIIGPGYLHYRVWHAACAFTGIPIPTDWQV